MVCRYEGDLLEHLESIETPTHCQTACNHTPDCNYFLYDHDKDDCELLDSDVRQCDALIGPPVPSIEECGEDHSTTTKITTTRHPTHPTTSFSSSTIAPVTTTYTTTHLPPTSVTTETTTTATTIITTTTTTTTTTSTSTTTTMATTTSTPKEFVIMVTGGFKDSNARLSDVEIVDPFYTDSNCLEPSDLKDKREGMIAAMFEGYPFVCGGSNGDNLDDCYKYLDGEWKLDNRVLIRSVYSIG